MKQITPEIKARVFALYWGQAIINAEGLSKLKRMDELNPIREGDFLEVKPLSAITDEDAKAIARRVWTDEIVGKVQIDDVKRWIKGIFLDGNLYSWEWDRVDDFTKDDEFFAIDYLRSKGYALPAFGFSVNELVEAGIFKLQEEK